MGDPKKDDDLVKAPAKGSLGEIMTCLFDRNSFRFLIFLIPLIAYTVKTQNYLIGIAAYVGFLLFCDILYYAFAVAVFDPECVISRGYNLSAFFHDALHGEGLDYGFNFYDGDYTKTRRQAQLDKFEFAYKALNLKEGMSLLDCGCGCGDWMFWLQTVKNIKVVGVNVTPQQVNEGRRRGLKVILSNWKDLDVEKEGLAGQFDAVSFWDTVEHYVNARDRANDKKRNEVYQAMYEMSNTMLKPKSESGRVWISCMHIRQCRRALPWYAYAEKLYYSYILDKFHSGSYPDVGRDPLVKNAEIKGLQLVLRKDTTKDYYDTSVLEPEHFGQHIFHWTPLRVFLALANLVLDPNAFQRMVWFGSSNWMFQFDKDDIDKSDIQHWWLAFERKPVK